jgi:hypothetical protein
MSTVDRCLPFPRATANRARRINTRLIDQMSRPGMERLAPEYIMMVGRDAITIPGGSISSTYDSEYPSRARELYRMTEDRLKRFTRIGVVPLDPKTLEAVLVSSDPNQADAFQRKLKSQIAIAEQVAPYEPPMQLEGLLGRRTAVARRRRSFGD